MFLGGFLARRGKNKEKVTRSSPRERRLSGWVGEGGRGRLKRGCCCGWSGGGGLENISSIGSNKQKGFFFPSHLKQVLLSFSITLWNFCGTSVPPHLFFYVTQQQRFFFPSDWACVALRLCEGGRDGGGGGGGGGEVTSPHTQTRQSNVEISWTAHVILVSAWTSPVGSFKARFTGPLVARFFYWRFFWHLTKTCVFVTLNFLGHKWTLQLEVANIPFKAGAFRLVLAHYRRKASGSTGFKKCLNEEDDQQCEFLCVSQRFKHFSLSPFLACSIFLTFSKLLCVCVWLFCAIASSRIIFLLAASEHTCCEGVYY